MQVQAIVPPLVCCSLQDVLQKHKLQDIIEKELCQRFCSPAFFGQQQGKLFMALSFLRPLLSECCTKAREWACCP